MRIQSMGVSNFRAISQVQLADLGDVVVIAGPNGCGKSCILDALRLLKSAYGGYQPNEWQQWSNEFQVNFASPTDLLRLFQDKQRSLQVFAEIELTESERTYIRSNAKTLLTQQLRQEIAPAPGPGVRYKAPLGSSQQSIDGEMDSQVRTNLADLLKELEGTRFRGSLAITPSGQIVGEPSLVLETLFSIYQPEHLGVIDYHGPQRNYAREPVSSISLSVDSQVQQLSQHALYNSANKYSNIKTQLASEYVRELLAQKAGSQTDINPNLTTTLKELFKSFFPDKEFEGPRPAARGALLFDVITARGRHDVDELSSGEKEVLYGYLRIRTSAPRNSVLLIDEPELHLNPGLVRNLPAFYHKHLGAALGNQLWLITHSDALLRRAVGRDKFSVFHMTSAGHKTETNQVRPVEVHNDVDQAVLDLVGDLAAYRPDAGIVIVEGGGDSNFDATMVSDLFPELLPNANLISAGSKQRVQALHTLLERASGSGPLAGLRLYSITDRDSSGNLVPTARRQFTWDRYHIENYLLEPEYIARILFALGYRDPEVSSKAAVESTLVRCAAEILPTLTGIELSNKLNEQMVACLNVAVSPEAAAIAADLHNKVAVSATALAQLAARLDLRALSREEKVIEGRLKSDLTSGAWINTFPGRSILGRFVATTIKSGTSYKVFRNLIIDRMKEDGFRPQGMKTIVDAIVRAEAEVMPEGSNG